MADAPSLTRLPSPLSDLPEGAEAPVKQALFLAAGRGARLSPYTDSMPTALIDIADRPMIAHNISALRRQGVTKFVVCKGWQGAAFDENLAKLGHGVELVDCPNFSTTGMLESIKLGLKKLDAAGFYIVYGDIIFRPSVARKIRECKGEVSVIVNSAKPGQQAKGFAETEVVTTHGEGDSRIVRRIGKNRNAKADEIAGEFGGIVKVSAAAHDKFLNKFNKLWQMNGSLPWWLDPIQKASLCDFLQFFSDEQMLTPCIIFTGWHEVNTPHDLTRAHNDTAAYLSEADARAQVSAMGACLLSEANDLKRPLTIVAQELNVGLEKLQCLLDGQLEVGDALDVLKKMSEVYPVPLNDLWLDADDTDCGVRICSADASEASARVLDRKNRAGLRTPYYEYRDAAMSRCSQFRPEWIKELRIVKSGDPLDPDVQLNNGHLMMQTTLFVGPVDFYWKDRHGRVQRREMNTGDSNFISPFVPHSFTSRDESKEALIIAVTYGGSVRRAFTEFSRVGAKRVKHLAGDVRNPELTRRCVLERHLEAECMTKEAFRASLTESGMKAERVEELLGGKEPSLPELERVAIELNVRASDLYVCGMTEEEEVVVTRTDNSRDAARRTKTYVMAPLARMKHQPNLKTFDMEVLPEAQPGETLQCGLHTFAYHFGSEPVELTWEDRRTGRQRAHVLRPGDSAYIAPCTDHRFNVSKEVGGKSAARPNPNGVCRGEGRRLFVVRIPGHLTGDTLNEFATFSNEGCERVGAETKQWFN
eukprot:TRINITY_DN111870_c0_g1_i1.p1 TRINITY_DN111870_c0_g1~~TRINITY_DN111870_c0_g1_i1.p1  ORF type:complete len:760 (+),score=169.26 TRINITY_DN111870_c0_g1_i1:98-2377(+)